MAKKTLGSVVKSGGATGTPVAELYEFKAPELTIDLSETTHLGTTPAYRTFISTLGDWGELEMQMALSGATITQFTALLLDDAATWHITFEYGGTDITMAFTGIITSLGFEPTPIDGKHVINAKVKVSGNITFAGLS